MDRRQGRRCAGRRRGHLVGPRRAADRHAKKRIFLLADPAATDFIGKLCTPWTVQFVYDTYALAKATGGMLTKSGGDTWFFITADYEFGYSLQRNTEAFVKEAGGKVLGAVRAPLATSDFSTYLLQAQASGAKVIGFANAGTDLQNCIKQAAEFGSPRAGCGWRRC